MNYNLRLYRALHGPNTQPLGADRVLQSLGCACQAILRLEPSWRLLRFVRDGALLGVYKGWMVTQFLILHTKQQRQRSFYYNCGIPHFYTHFFIQHINNLYQPIEMTNSTKTTGSSPVRLQNEFGADHWVRNPAAEYRRPTMGRGLFAGLQDTKHYNVENGWARRKSTDSQTGILGSLWSRLTGA